MIVNNLGIPSGVGILPALHQLQSRCGPNLPIPSGAYAVQGASNSVGGSGNDIINIGGEGPPGPQGEPGPEGPQGEPGTPGLVPVTEVTTTPFEVSLTDYYLAVNVDEPTSIILPVAPTGTVFIIKDIDGDASINPITVTASTTIDGAASALINTDYGSITLIFNGTEWNIV
jgi:hypothetical protein